MSLLLANCTRPVDGRPIYVTETPSNDLPLVKIDQLPPLMLTPAEAGTVINDPNLAGTLTYTEANHVPDGFLSDLKCAGVMAPGAELTYRGSGYQSVYGEMLVDQDQPRVGEVAIAYGGGEEAQAFVDTATSQWKYCAGRTLTVNVQEPPVNWIASAPHRSDGVDVLLRRMEGGQGFACARAMAARSNIVVDVLVCGTDDADLEHQGATIVNMALSRIRK
ncbi:MAG TPA: sensor domain-containing protein [Mycobacterium sp.]|nr:sensor domain-containing protein [Mycobacterium sp.]